MAEQSEFLCYFASIHADGSWMRQTEDGKGGMGAVRFRMHRDRHADALKSAPLQQAAWLVVFDEAPRGAMTSAPVERRILFVTEPPEIKKYPRSYLQQFGTVVAPFNLRGVDKRRMVVGNPCLNWHYGISRTPQGHVSRFDRLDTLRNLPVPEKTGLISVICSSKTATEAQRKRLALVDLLRKSLGESLHVFGRGFNPVDDKMTAIAPYKYHIVLENNYLDNFWTEKLSDAWLGWALPLYLGAPNLAEVCPARGFVALRKDAPEENVRLVAGALEQELWDRRQIEIARCRQWMLETTNVFARAAAIITTAPERFHRLPELEESEPLYGVDRDSVAALYQHARV